MISTGDTHITRDQGTAGWEERMPKTRQPYLMGTHNTRDLSTGVLKTRGYPNH